MKKQFKVVKLLPLRQGVSEQTGREWKSRDVVLTSTEPVMYPDCIVATLKGDAAEDTTLKDGDIVEAVLAFFAHEHDGRWYNNVRIVSVTQ